MKVGTHARPGCRRCCHQQPVSSLPGTGARAASRFSFVIGRKYPSLLSCGAPPPFAVLPSLASLCRPNNKECQSARPSKQPAPLWLLAILATVAPLRQSTSSALSRSRNHTSAVCSREPWRAVLAEHNTSDQPTNQPFPNCMCRKHGQKLWHAPPAPLLAPARPAPSSCAFAVHPNSPTWLGHPAACVLPSAKDNTPCVTHKHIDIGKTSKAPAACTQAFICALLCSVFPLTAPKLIEANPSLRDIIIIRAVQFWCPTQHNPSQLRPLVLYCRL